jgi:hypothetical protein
LDLIEATIEGVLYLLKIKDIPMFSIGTIGDIHYDNYAGWTPNLSKKRKPHQICIIQLVEGIYIYENK